MFGMIFGTTTEAFAASRTVRSLHDKVTGEIGEDIGAFKPASKFDAAQLSALIWVGATLTESSIMKYELFVGKLTEAEKDEFVKLAQNQNQLFGIPKSKEPLNYKQFMAYCNAMWNSSIIELGPTSSGIFDFLLDPPSLMYAPLMDSVKWSTATFHATKISGQGPWKTCYILGQACTRVTLRIHSICVSITSRKFSTFGCIH